MRRAISFGLVIPVLILTGCVDGEGAGTVQTQQHQQPIVGGAPAGAWEYPATGGLVRDGEIFCTGTLVAPSAVLTAAHCLDPEEMGDDVPGFTLVRDEAQITDWGNEVYEGMNVRMHPGYNKYAYDRSPGLVNDIGILLLRRAVEDVEPEPLLAEGVANAVLEVGTTLTIVGYGYTDLALTSSGIKYKATTPVVEVGPFELQMSEPGDPQPCYGDSGGPVYVTLPDGDRFIAGIVSRGPGEEGGCDQGAIATRADPYKEWVASASETASCATAGSAGPSPSIALALLLVLFWMRRRRSCSRSSVSR